MKRCRYSLCRAHLAGALLLALLLLLGRGANPGHAQTVVEDSPAPQLGAEAPLGEKETEEAAPEEEFGDLPEGSGEGTPSGQGLFPDGGGLVGATPVLLPVAPAPWEPSEELEGPGGREPDAFVSLGAPEPAHVGVVGIPDYAYEPYEADVVRTELLPRTFAGPLDREGFRFAVGGQLNYDSNIFLEESGGVSDLFFVLAPAVEYRSAPDGVPGVVDAFYRPFVRLYLDESSLNTIDHSAGLDIAFESRRTALNAGVRYGRFTRSDRFVREVLESENLLAFARGEYNLTEKTSIEAGWRGNRIENLETGGTRSTTSRFELTGWWQTTVKTRVGPSVRYTDSTSDTTGDREAIAVMAVVDSSPRQELNLSAGLGVERVRGDRVGGGSDTSPTGRLAVDYRPSEKVSLFGDLRYEAISRRSAVRFDRGGGGEPALTGQLVAIYRPNRAWAFRAEARAETFPSQDTAGYSIADQVYSLVVTRFLPAGALSLEGDLSFADYEQVGDVAENRRNQETYGLAVRYTHWLLAERTALDSVMRWSTNRGNGDWDRFQASLGLNYQF